MALRGSMLFFAALSFDTHKAEGEGVETTLTNQITQSLNYLVAKQVIDCTAEQNEGSARHETEPQTQLTCQ